jgi:hypothetical protein
MADSSNVVGRADPRLGEGCGYATVPIRTCAACGKQGVMENVEAIGKTAVLCPTDARDMRKLIEILEGMEE